MAHAEILSARSIIPAQDYADIERGMRRSLSEIYAGAFQWLLGLETAPEHRSGMVSW